VPSSHWTLGAATVVIACTLTASSIMVPPGWAAEVRSVSNQVSPLVRTSPPAKDETSMSSVWFSLGANASLVRTVFAALSEKAAATPEDPAPPPPPAPVDCAIVTCVALTFDDGPMPTTPGLLAALASRDVKATFFVVGTMVQHRPADVAAIQAAGHVIGNHTYAHPHMTKRPADWLAGQIAADNEAIAAAGGIPSNLFRPPYGERTNALTQAEVATGMVGVLWNVDPADWADPGPEAIVQRVVSAVKPGSIVLLHDIHQGTVDAVPALIDALRAQGYTLVTVPELIGSPPPGTSVFSGPKPPA